MLSKRVEIATSPCPNDVFLLSGLILKRIPTSLNLEFHFADIETLNNLALSKSYPVIKASFALYPRIEETYQILACGSAMGYGVGPLLVSRKKANLAESSCLKVALPGRFTTAHFLFDHFYPHLTERIFLPYHQIIPALIKGEADLGVLIHEGRFVFAQYGLTLVADLGKLWEEKTKVPLPLGSFFIKRDYPPHLKGEILSLFRKSLDFAWEHKEELYPLLKKYAQELEREVIFSHVETYVNNYTYRLEGKALEGLRIFLKHLGLAFDPQLHLWECEDGIP